MGISIQVFCLSVTLNCPHIHSPSSLLVYDGKPMGKQASQHFDEWNCLLQLVKYSAFLYTSYIYIDSSRTKCL